MQKLEKDGQTYDTYSEEYRNYCEAKWVIANLPDKIDLRKKNKYTITKRQYLVDVERIRGKDAMNKLRNEMVRLWNLPK